MNWIGLRRFVFCAASIILAGCSDNRGTVPVRGTVRYEGKPLAKASVTFLTQDVEGRDARGYTDESGAFVLSTFGTNDGVLPGTYKVIVEVAQEVDSSVVAATPDEAQRAMTEGRLKTKPGSIVLSSKYSQPDQTILQQEVPAAGDVVFDLKRNP